MNKEKLTALLTLIIPSVIELIMKNNNVDYINAIKGFYNSKLYEKLSDIDTSLWHLSPATLFTLYDEEIKTGFITFPLEQ
jgi:hypothetical protein